MSTKRVVDEEMRFNIVINGNSAQKELYDLEKANKKLTNSNKDLRAEQARLVSQGKKNSQEYKNLSAQIKANNSAINTNKNRMKALQTQLGVTGLTMSQLRKKASMLRLQLNNMIPGSEKFKSLQAELKEVNAQITKLSMKSRATKGTLSQMADGFNKYAALGASVVAGLTGIVLTAQKVIDYNGKLADSQSNVQKTTGLTAEEVDNLTKKFGLFKTRTARIELLQLAEEAGRLGKDSVEDVLSFVRVANQIKVALGDDLGEEQIREVGKMVTIYKVAEREGKNFEESMLALGSSINEVSASGANQAGFLVDFIKRTGGISDVAKISAQDMIGLAAAFDEAGQSQEISATAINKFYGSAAKDVKEFARVAGLSVKEFSQLLEEDANQALIMFLKGLKEGDPTLEQMAKRLDGIELGGTRGAQAISALAANVENLENKQSIANNSLKEATSLTNEYELKNNNLAATLDKVKKRFQAAFSSDAVIGILTGLTNIFGRLIGAIEDVNEAFAEETKSIYESAKANRKLANESQNLLNRYNELTKDGVEPTKEAKEELDLITLQLKDRLGESVMSINEETGAYILNTEAVKKQIKMKRLAADEEASTLASRLGNTQDKIKELKSQEKLAEKEYNLRKKFFEEQNKETLDAFASSNSLTPMEEQRILERSEGYKELAAARRKLQSVNSEILAQTEQEIDLMQKLNEYNYTQADIDAFFSVDKKGTNGPSEGDTKEVDGVTFVFKNGKWVVQKTYKPTGPKDSSKVTNYKSEADELLKLQRASIDNRLALMAEGYAKELALENEHFSRKIEDLKLKQEEYNTAYDKAIASGDTKLAEIMLKKSQEIDVQIEQSKEMHYSKLQEINSKNIENTLQKLTEQFQKQEELRQTKHNEELAALGNDLEARKALKNKFKRESLEREKEHQELLRQELLKVIDTVQNLDDFDIELLSEDQKQLIIDRLQALGLKISEINNLLAQMSGKSTGNKAQEELNNLGFGNGLDILGMSQEQWQQMFTNTETLAGSLGKVVNMVGAATEAYRMFAEFQSASENRRLQQFEQNANKEKAKLKTLYDNKFLTQKQYDDAVRKIDEDLDKKKAEIAYKQAKRERQMAIANIALNTAQAIMSIWAQVNKADFGVTAGILTAFVTALGGLQLATVLKTPLPAKGYESGYYGKMPIRREQDGKMFNAEFGGMSRSGVVDKPTLFLAGEQGKNFPEMIIDGRTLSRFNPELKESLYRELGRVRVRGFENGYYKNDNYQVPEENNEAMLIVLNRAVSVLEKLEKNGVIAYMSRDFNDIRRLRDRINELEKAEKKANIG